MFVLYSKMENEFSNYSLYNAQFPWLNIDQ